MLCSYSRLHYFKAGLLTHLIWATINLPSPAFSAATCFISAASSGEHIISIFHSLRWLPVYFRIDFIILMFVFQGRLQPGTDFFGRDCNPAGVHQVFGVIQSSFFFQKSQSRGTNYRLIALLQLLPRGFGRTICTMSDVDVFKSNLLTDVF